MHDRSSPRRLTTAAALATALGAGMPAAAQPAAAPPAAAPPPAAPAPPATAPALSPAEMAEIQRALGVDRTAAPPPPAPPPSIPVPNVVAQAVASMNPAISFIADFALAAFSSDNKQIGGHDPYQNGFNLQALEMSASADVDPYLRFDAHIVFGHDGVEVEEAYATTHSLPGNLQVRAGQFLTRFGRINASHPHTWDFVDQPLVIGKMMGGDGNRGLGAEISWLTPLPWYTELIVSETQATGASTAASFYGATDLGVKNVKDLETTIALKQFHALSADWSLSMGLSAALGPNPTFRGAESVVVGGDLYLKYRPITRQSATVVSLTAEVLSRRRETAHGILADSGLYTQLVWRFAERWTTGARYDFVTGVRGDYIPADQEWVSARHRATADLTFYPTEFSRLRVQGSADVPTWLSTPIYAAFLALEVAVGAHGAHAF